MGTLNGYEVVWDGAVSGPNRGLLCVQADTVRPAPRLSREGSGYRGDRPDRRREALEILTSLLDRGAYTRATIQQVTGLSRTLVDSTLVRLRREGRLQWTKRAGYGTVSRYWLRPQEEIA